MTNRKTHWDAGVWQRLISAGSLLAAIACVGLEPGSAQAYCAYVSSVGQVFVIDTWTNVIADTIPVGGLPAGVALSTDGRSAYVASCGASCEGHVGLQGIPLGDTVSVIDTSTNMVTDRIRVGTGPLFLAITPDDRFVYVTICGPTCGKPDQGGNALVVIDTTTKAVTTIPGVGPGGVTIRPDGAFAYVANVRGDPVSKIDTRSKAVVDQVALGDYHVSGGIVITPAGRLLYVAGSGAPSSVVDSGSLSIVDTFDLWNGGDGNLLAISRDGARVYVAQDSPNGVSVIDTASNAVNAFVAIEPRAIWPAVTPDGALLYVTTLETSLAVIDTATRETSTLTLPGVSFLTAIASVPGGCTGSFQCVGDCDLNRRVAAHNIVAMVSIALGKRSIETCAVGDANRDGRITGDDLQLAVEQMFEGCPARAN